MYFRPRRLTSLQTRVFGLALLVIGAALAWDVVVSARLHHGHTFRSSLLAAPALLVGPWLLATGTAGARTLPESPVWHRVVSAVLAAVGFGWGVMGFGDALARWFG